MEQRFQIVKSGYVTDFEEVEPVIIKTFRNEDEAIKSLSNMTNQEKEIHYICGQQLERIGYGAKKWFDMEGYEWKYIWDYPQSKLKNIN